MGECPIKTREVAKSDYALSLTSNRRLGKFSFPISEFQEILLVGIWIGGGKGRRRQEKIGCD